MTDYKSDIPEKIYEDDLGEVFFKQDHSYNNLKGNIAYNFILTRKDQINYNKDYLCYNLWNQLLTHRLESFSYKA